MISGKTAPLDQIDKNNTQRRWVSLARKIASTVEQITQQHKHVYTITIIQFNKQEAIDGYATKQMHLSWTTSLCRLHPYTNRQYTSWKPSTCWRVSSESHDVKSVEMNKDHSERTAFLSSARVTADALSAEEMQLDVKLLYRRHQYFMFQKLTIHLVIVDEQILQSCYWGENLGQVRPRHYNERCLCKWWH